ncbi:MAG: lipid-A-disaccharide synthase [Bacteroidota bacterium]|nr:lipid-A-disaccharide synthase [Bacteroidota bacterium]
MIQRVMIIAGEASGDVHGAGVVRELKLRQPNIEIFGIGGDKMQREGMQLIYHVREMSFMGFVEVVKHLPLIRSVEKTLEQLLRFKKPDVVVLIDYPGFNLRFARTVKKYGIKVIYYISPQVWAWKKGRVKKMKGLIDRMLVVFPFEVPIYEHEQIPVQFVGHPLVEEMQEIMSKQQFLKRFGLDETKKIIAVIPGSREQEIENVFSVMVRAAATVAGNEKEIVVAVAPNLPLELYQYHIPPNINVKFIQHATHEVMRYAEFAFVTSGTATLETACSETPMVVVYRTSALTYWIARFVVRIKNIALVNIVAGKTIVPEMIQHNATVDALANEAKKILTSPERYGEMKNELKAVREKLGGVGASAHVADAILAI